MKIGKLRRKLGPVSSGRPKGLADAITKSGGRSNICLYKNPGWPLLLLLAGKRATSRETHLLKLDAVFGANRERPRGLAHHDDMAGRAVRHRIGA